jgi:hypothetical protein
MSRRNPLRRSRPLIEDPGGISIVLVLSVLIIAALAVAVASFFVAGTQWLLIVSAGLIVLAFYVSRRTSRGGPDPEVEHSPAPVRGQVGASIDQLGLDESGREHSAAGHADDDRHDSELDRDESDRQPEAGRAIAG